MSDTALCLATPPAEPVIGAWTESTAKSADADAALQRRPLAPDAVRADGTTTVELNSALSSRSGRLLKSIEDKVLASVILILIAPVMLIIAALIKVTSRGPVLFVQERHGLGGSRIRVLKFRTMNDPIDESACFYAGDRTSDDFRPCVHGDPRVNRLGRLLRNTSLDELPQFFNVLRGDMSIVGPRPHALKLNDDYAPKIAGLMSRHAVKPGITGLAQISGARGEIRNTDQMRRRISLDMFYLRNWSLWLDVKIIAISMVKGFYNRQP